MADGIGFCGSFKLSVYDSRMRLLDWCVARNSPTTDGLADAAKSLFAAGTQRTAWYFGLIAGSGYTGVSAGDTMSSHSGWTEATAYSQSARPQWTLATPTEAAATYSIVSQFTFSSEVSIRGIFVSSNSTKGGSTGILWATALLPAARTFQAGQNLTAGYTVRLYGGDVS